MCVFVRKEMSTNRIEIASPGRICDLIPLRRRHNEHDGVSNRQPSDCLLKRLFRRRSKETSKLRVTGLCVGNSPVTGEFPAQRASSADNVSIWWRHHAIWRGCLTSTKNPFYKKDGRSISAMGFPILMRWHLHIESAPWYLWNFSHHNVSKTSTFCKKKTSKRSGIPIQYIWYADILFIYQNLNSMQNATILTAKQIPVCLNWQYMVPVASAPFCVSNKLDVRYEILFRQKHDCENIYV